MRQFLALVLVATVAFSATANVKNSAALLTGFASGLNFGELSPSLENCTTSMDSIVSSGAAAIAAAQNQQPDVFEQAVSMFGYNFAHTIRTCGSSLDEIKGLFNTIAVSIKELNQTVLMNRFFANMFAINQKFGEIKAAVAANDYTTAGAGVAAIFKVLILGETSMTAKTARKLGELTKLFSPQVVFDLNATVLGFQGFIEEANTTIAVGDYLNLVADSSNLVALFPVLEKAIESFDFATIVSTVTTISSAIPVVGKDFSVVKNQTTSFIQRDLPLFTNEATLTKAVEALFLDIPTTFTNIQRITNAYKNADYRELGHGTGGVYNQLRNGALGGF